MPKFLKLTFCQTRKTFTRNKFLQLSRDYVKNLQNLTLWLSEALTLNHTSEVIGGTKVRKSCFAVYLISISQMECEQSYFLNLWEDASSHHVFERCLLTLGLADALEDSFASVPSSRLKALFFHRLKPSKTILLQCTVTCSRTTGPMSCGRDQYSLLRSYGNPFWALRPALQKESNRSEIATIWLKGLRRRDGNIPGFFWRDGIQIINMMTMSDFEASAISEMLLCKFLFHIGNKLILRMVCLKVGKLMGKVPSYKDWRFPFQVICIDSIESLACWSMCKLRSAGKGFKL